MAPSPSSQTGDAPDTDTAATASARKGKEGRDGEELLDWDIQSTPQPSQPYIDYKRLAIEVATRIAPDLQETLETTIQVSLQKLQADIHTHAGRLTELENRVSSLEDENNVLSTTVTNMSTDISRLGDKLEDLENRSRRNNLRMVGLSETVLHKELQHICAHSNPIF